MYKIYSTEIIRSDSNRKECMFSYTLSRSMIHIAVKYRDSALVYPCCALLSGEYFLVHFSNHGYTCDSYYLEDSECSAWYVTVPEVWAKRYRSLIKPLTK